VATATQIGEELRNVCENSRLAVAFVDAGLRLRAFSPEFARVFDLRDRDRWRPLWDAVSELIPEQGWSERLDAAIRTGIRCEGPLEVPRLGQTFLLTVTGYRTGAGALDGAVLALSDVTELRRARRDRSQLTAVVATSPDAIVGLDPDGLVLSWNPAAERLFGWTGEEVLGRDISVLVPEERKAESDEALLRLRRGERPESARTQRRHKDGRIVSVAVEFAPANGVGGKIEGSTMIARETAEGLEARLYGTAHDLRGPVRSIGSFAELLLFEFGATLDPVAKDYVERIARAAQKMDQLVTGLARP
jgi:PAS domain S-box-containing protein